MKRLFSSSLWLYFYGLGLGGFLSEIDSFTVSVVVGVVFGGLGGVLSGMMDSKLRVKV